MMHEKQNHVVRPSTTCPNCGKVGKLPHGMSGWPKSVRCKGCKTDFDPRDVKPDVIALAPQGLVPTEYDIVWAIRIIDLGLTSFRSTLMMLGPGSTIVI